MNDASICSSSVASGDELMRGSPAMSAGPGTTDSYRAAMNFRIYNTISTTLFGEARDSLD
jgi:hypothetical protein